MNPEVRAELQKIYDKIPKIDCQGLCTRYCSVIGGTKAEFHNMEQAGGEKPRCTNNLVCNFLKNNKCSIYRERPYVCRLYGSSPDILCKFGCVPDRVLTKEESYKIALEIHNLLDENNFLRIVWNASNDQVIADMAINAGTDFITMRDEVEKMHRELGIEEYEQY